MGEEEIRDYAGGWAESEHNPGKYRGSEGWEQYPLSFIVGRLLEIRPIETANFIGSIVDAISSEKIKAESRDTLMRDMVGGAISVVAAIDSDDVPDEIVSNQDIDTSIVDIVPRKPTKKQHEILSYLLDMGLVDRFKEVSLSNSEALELVDGTVNVTRPTMITFLGLLRDGSFDHVL